MGNYYKSNIPRSYKTLLEEYLIGAPIRIQTDRSGREFIRSVLRSAYSICEIPFVSGTGTCLAYSLVNDRISRGRGTSNRVDNAHVERNLRPAKICVVHRHGRTTDLRAAIDRFMSRILQFKQSRSICIYSEVANSQNPSFEPHAPMRSKT
jgi:hypothetical protein